MFAYIYHRPRLLIRAYKYLFGYDKNEIRYTRESLSAGDVAFDIGAHKGAYAYWMRRSVKAKGKVLCIEPQPILYNYLNKIFKIFGFSNVILMDCAISDKDTKGQITVPGKPGSISQGARIDNFNLVKNKHKDDIHTIDVQVRSIDSIVKETGLKPNLIKIDVEGHELNVLKGMVYTLVNIRPKIIIECEERHIKGFSVYDVFNLLLEKDYIGYYFENAQKMPLNNFNLERDQTAHLRENHKPEIKYVANFIFEPN